MYPVGLTGNIGSGKTIVSKLFAKYHNISIISADECAREVINQADIIQSIVKHFGNQVLSFNKNINREYLRDIIAKSQIERKWLDQLMHPIIQEKIYQKTKKK